MILNLTRVRNLVLGLMLMCSAPAAWPPTASADEGMWLFNNPPRKLLREKYGFDPTQAWLEHLQKSSVRFNSGGSGSLVSSRGLVMTNHHVGADALYKLSTPQRDLLAEGYYAQGPDEELKCVDLELNVLQSIEDVTERVNGAVPSGADPAEAERARRAVMAEIEQQSLDATGLRSDVVTLYQGGLYHLYRYRRYTDVRLVFAPEKEIAFFGGDPDNFEFPRYDLDVCFFRIYENDHPAKVEHFLAWSLAGAGDGELVFVSGHPGRTNRLNTVAHLEFERDVAQPQSLNLIRRIEVLLKTFSDRSLENARRAEDELFGYQNSRKARLGMLGGLQDPAIMAAKRDSEAALRKAVAANPKLRAQFGDAWDQVADSLKVLREIYVDHLLLERPAAVNSDLFRIARTLVRLVAEDAKPSGERLREYRDSNRPSLEQELFSAAPIYEDLEIAKLGNSLSLWMELKGADDPLLVKALGGKAPQARAAELVLGCKLKEVELRRKLAGSTPSDLAAEEDPMVELALLLDPEARAIRTRYEEQVEEPQRQAYAKIAGAQFALRGTEVYPDATFTLRLAFGPVRGYEENGQQVLPWTRMGDIYAHAEAHGSVSPFSLPKRWLERRDRLDPDTPFNFVSTADIIGGNSGSPVVNRAGEVVGIIFDGNIQSLVLAYAYTDAQARATSVAAPAIRESLRKIYDAEALADELGQ